MICSLIENKVSPLNRHVQTNDIIILVTQVLMMSKLANNILYLRKKNKLKQSEIAAQLGFKRNTWSNWENDVSVPDIETVRIISAFFNVGIGDMLNVDLTESNLNENGTGVKYSTKSNLKSNPLSNLNEENRLKSGMVREPQITYGSGPARGKILPKEGEDKDQVIAAQKLAINALQQALSLAQDQIKLLNKGTK
jgi:transcriptional regulator with XRE-family HTH domain